MASTLNSSSRPYPSSSSQHQQEREPEFAVAIARHVLTDAQRQRLILLDASRPSRIVSRFCSYLRTYVFNVILNLLESTPSATSAIRRRFVNADDGFYEVFFVYKTVALQETISTISKRLDGGARLMRQDGIIFVPRPVPGPVPAHDGLDYAPRGLIHQILQIPTLPTPVSLFLSDGGAASALFPASNAHAGAQRTPKASGMMASVAPPRPPSQGGSAIPAESSQLPAPQSRDSYLPKLQGPEPSMQHIAQLAGRPSVPMHTQPPRKSISQTLPQLSASFSSHPSYIPGLIAMSSTPPGSVPTTDGLRAEFAVIHAKILISSQQIDIYRLDKEKETRFWTYIGQFARPFWEDFIGARSLGRQLDIQSRLIRINNKSYREIFFVCYKPGQTRRTDSQSPLDELKKHLEAVGDSMHKMGMFLLCSPGEIPSQDQLYSPSSTMMSDIRAVPAVAIAPHFLPGSASLATKPSRAAPPPKPSAVGPSSSSIPLSGSTPSAGMLNPARPKPPTEIIELSDSDDDDIEVRHEPPSATQPVLQPAFPLARPKGSMRDEPIDIDALETEVIDLTDSPEAGTVALFEELPLSKDSSMQQVAFAHSLPLLDISEEEPAPNSPEPKAMEVEADSTSFELPLGPSPSHNQGHDRLDTPKQTLSPVPGNQVHILASRESAILVSPAKLISSQSQQKADDNNDDDDDDDDDPLDFLGPVRRLGQQRLGTPDHTSDVEMRPPSSNGSKKSTSGLTVNVDTQHSEFGPNTPLSATSSDADAIEEDVEDISTACSEWAREMASHMEPRVAIKYLRRAAEYRKDPLDSSFSDRMRAQPIDYQLASYNRRIFESWIISSSMNEPEAPPIDVKNTVDDTPCPSWDFTYTNLLIRGDGVPKPPKPSDLEGCNCVGGCRSDITVCSCAQKNMQFAEARNTTGFLYDTQGRLQEFAFPVFECNEACSCAEYCNNRVAQRGRKCNIDIRKTENRGWGVFASEDIPKGTYLGVYSGELLRDEEAEVRGKVYNDYNRAYLFDIDFWYIKLYMKKKGRKFRKGEFCVDAMHAGCFTRYFNHSCDPNSIIVPCVFGEAYPEIPYLAFFTIDPIPKDQEITFSYRGTTITDERDRNAARLRADARRRLGKKKTVKPGTKTFGVIDTPCACGTVLCTGSMWNQESSDEDEDEELDGSDGSESI